MSEAPKVEQPKPAATGNETAVLVNTNAPPGKDKHIHHGMEITCKAGVDAITIPPMVGHDQPVKYVRTKDTDEAGRAVFRPEAQ